MKVHKQKHTFSVEQKKAALWAGISLLIMAAAAGIAYGAIHRQLYFPGSMDATGQAVGNHHALLLTEIALWLIILLTDILVSVKLYSFFKPTGNRLSLAAAGLRLLYSAFLAAAIVFLIKSIRPETAFDNMTQFSKIWSIGLIVFGIHLSLLAVLALKSSFVPFILSILLLIAGPAYSVIHLLYNSGDGFASASVSIEKFLSAPMASAEILLALWLLIVAFSGRKGVS